MQQREWPVIYRWPDARRSLPAGLRRAGQKLHLVATSPPYWAKRRYSEDDNEWGAGSLDQFIVDVLDHARQVRHVLRPWGWFALNLGDTRSGSGGAGGDAKTAGQRVYRQGA